MIPNSKIEWGKVSYRKGSPIISKISKADSALKQLGSLQAGRQYC